MKNKTFLMIISAMVFGTATLAGVIVLVIILMSKTPSDDMAAQSLETTNNIPDSVQQNDPGFVYLYQNQTDLVRVSLADGSAQTFSIGIPGDNSVYPGRLSFSDDGRLLAYCAQDRLPDDITLYRLVIRDIVREETIRESHFGAIQGCEVSAFNQDATEVAVGIVYNTPVMNAYSDRNQPDWELQINSVYENRITHLLRQGDPQAPDYESMREDFWFEEGIPAMLVVREFTTEEILFTAYPYIGRDGPPQVPAHRWNLTTGEITALDGLTQLGANYLPGTGEIVYPELDESFTAAQPLGPMPRANTIRINHNGEIRTIYRNSEYVIASTQFINGGRQIATLLIGGWDENNPDEIAPSRYEVINRDGSLGQTSSGFISYNQMRGTSDGMVILTMTQPDTDGSLYQLATYHNNEMNILWSSQVTVNQGYEFVWASPMPLAEGLQDFTTID